MKDLAQYGSYEDTQMAHVAPGEMVVPRQILDNNPLIARDLGEAFSSFGVNPNEYIIGSSTNSINPVTGYPEFGFFKKVGKFLKKTGDFFDGDRAARKARNAQNDAIRAQESKQDSAWKEAYVQSQIDQGKYKRGDVTDPNFVNQFFEDTEGTYNDPFPEYLRPAGDQIISGINETAENIEDYTGSPDELMAGFKGTYDKMQGMQDSATDQLSSIYDGRMDSKLGGFNNKSDAIVERLKGINTNVADTTKGLQQDVLSAGQNYADALGESVNTQVDLANKEFDVRGQGARAMAAAERAAAGDAARAAQRSLGSQGGGTNANMMSAMLASNLGQQQAGSLAQNIIDNEAGRYEKLGEINPGLADVYRNEAMLGNANTALEFGDVQSQAMAENLGMDQGMIDADQQLYSDLLSQKLANVGMIPSMGMQKAMLPSMYGEAALAGQGSLASKVAPFTSMGASPSTPQAVTANQYIPPSSNSNKIFDTMAAIPKVMDTIGKAKNIFKA